MGRYAPLALLLLAYFFVAGLFAVNTPDWQAPDEPAHYNYVRQLADGRLPIIEAGDYDQDYQSLVISSRFDPKYTVDTFQYEDYQPPLYYFLQTPVFWLSGGLLHPMRLLSVVLGAGVVILAYFITRKVLPGRQWLALTAAAFVAFLPQHVAMLAAVNNDSLAELLIAAILLLLVSIAIMKRIEREKPASEAELGSTGPQKIPSNWQLLLLGFLLGLGFLTKVTVYIMVPVVGLVLLWIYWGSWRSLLKAALIVFGVAGLIGLTWWVRNLVVYGGFDILGTVAHNAIVIGQPRTIDWIATIGLGGMLRAFAQTTFQSFWGQFGWMGVVMPSWVYGPLLLFTVLTGLSLAWVAGQSWKQKWPVSHQSNGLPWNVPAAPILILLATFALSLAVYLAYNLTFVQHQGRYLFPALVPISVGVAVAWGALIGPVARRWPRAAYLLPGGLALGLFGLDLLALYRFIVPALG